MVFPSMPRLLQDFWVVLELAFTLLQFIFTCIAFHQEQNTPYTITALILSCLDFVLAMTDGCLYFVTAGVCVLYYQILVGKFQKYTPRHNEQCCSCLKSEWAERLNKWFELARTIASECLLYPLIVLDLMGFIFETVYSRQQLSTYSGRRDFSLFSLANVYLVASVYIIRMVMIIQTVLSLNQIPVDFSGSKSSYIQLVKQFGVTSLLQVLTSIVIIIAVGVKISQDAQFSDHIYISPYLWCVIITGWYLPIFGIVSFFFINYYWVNEFSTTIFIDLMSMLQGASFAEAVFSSDTKQVAVEKANQIASDIGLMDARKNYRNYKSDPSNTTVRKLLYPLKNPFVVTVGFLYNFSLLAFLACLFVQYNPTTGELRFAAFVDSTYGTMLILLGMVLLIANINTLLVITLWFIVAVGSIFTAIIGLLFCFAQVIFRVPKTHRAGIKYLPTAYYETLAEIKV